jgi:hypothetical protein
VLPEQLQVAAQAVDPVKRVLRLLAGLVGTVRDAGQPPLVVLQDGERFFEV